MTVNILANSTSELRRLEIINGERLHVMLDDGSGAIYDYDTVQKIAQMAESMRSAREAREEAEEDRAHEINRMMTPAEHPHACNCAFGPQDPRCCIAKAQRRVIEDAHRLGRQGKPLPEQSGPLRQSWRQQAAGE